MKVESRLTEAISVLADDTLPPDMVQSSALYALVRLAWLSEEISSADVGRLLGIEGKKKIRRQTNLWANQGITGVYVER